jgi:hypothetical protein
VRRRGTRLLDEGLPRVDRADVSPTTITSPSLLVTTVPSENLIRPGFAVTDRMSHDRNRW